jgi:hypothetical protein
LGFSFFKRPAHDSERPSTPPSYRPGALCFAGCGRSEGWQCSYVDTHGAACHSWWCAEHVAVIDGTPFCRRHVAVAKLLVERVGSIFEVPPPNVNDRALPMLLRLAELLDARMVELLRRVYANRPEVSVPEHGTIRERREEGRPAGWECVWAANSSSGYLTTISFRVTSHEPPVIQLARDGHLLREGTPAWIDHHPNDTMHPEELEDFLQEVFETVLRTFMAVTGAA